MRRFNVGFWVVVVLSLLASLPLLKQAGLPNGDDVLYHVYRVAEMDRSWASNIFFPRWAEGLYYGYGSPLWHFYASLAYYSTSALVRLLGSTPIDALRALIVVCYLGMGIGMYAFMRQQIGRLAGVLSAVTYVYSPYILFTLPYARGAYPELLALALFPMVMWRFGALVRAPHGMNVAWAAGSAFLLVIAHNLMAIVLVTILGAWLVWNMIATWLNDRAHAGAFLYGFIALVVGVGLASYFWIPVLLEGSSVSLDNLTSVVALDYHNFFVPMSELLRPLSLSDMGAINGLNLVTRLGMVQWVGAGMGLFTVMAGIAYAWQRGYRDHPIFRQGVFFALVGAFFLYMITPQSAWVWESVRQMAYLQFPWRFLGVVAFAGAVLVGFNAVWLLRLPPRFLGVGAGVAVFAIGATGVPAFTVPEWRYTEIDTSIVAYHQAEMNGFPRGTTFTDEYRPHKVFTMPSATDKLIKNYAQGAPIDKANVPADVTTRVIEQNPIWLEWEVTTPHAFTMEVLNFYWDGWAAYVDNQRVPIEPANPHGFITFPVPEGTHNVKVYLGATLPRLFGNTVSMLMLLVLLGVVTLKMNVFNPNISTDAQGDIALLPVWARVGVVAGAAGVLALAILNPIGLTWRNTPYGDAPAQHPTDYTLDSQFRIIGYDLNSDTFNAGDVVEVTVYWLPLTTTDVNFSSFVHVGTVGTPPIAQSDKQHPAGRVMNEWWLPIGYLADFYSITLPTDLPSGEYAVLVGLYTCALTPEGEACGNGYRPTVTDAKGTVLGDVVPLVSVTVR